MRKICYLIFAVVLCATEAKAQFSVEDESKTTTGKVEFVDRLKEMDASTEYYSEAAARAERRRIREERNYLEINAKLQGSMTSYNDAWTTSRGGDNAMTVLGTFTLKHTFKKGDFNIATDLSARYGYNRIKVEDESGDSRGIWFKNIDEFWFQTQPSHKIRKNWSMSALVKLRSQFSSTYLSRTSQGEDDVISGLFTPGYLDVSVGFTFKSPKPKFPIEISLNPLSTSGTWATNDKVRHYYKDIKGDATWFGIDIDKNSLFTGGSSVNIKFSRKWGKTEWFAYDTNLYCYYGWLTNVGRAGKIRRYNDYLDDLRAWESGGSIGPKPAAVPTFVSLHPTIEWRNTLSFKASKYISTDIYFQLNYDKAQNTSVQIYSMLTLGLTYTFKNKEKK